MLTSKERKKLSGMAQTIEPVFQIGKNGWTDVTVKELSDVLDARELIKVSILKNSDEEPRDVLNELCDALGAEPISCIGSKIVLYRRSTRKDVKHIEF